MGKVSKVILKRYFDNCSLSMDKVSISIFILGNETEKEFFEALTNLGFECKYDYRIENNKKKYQRRRKYIVKNAVIIFTYQRKHDARYLPDICCAYQNPSRPVLNLLDSLCNSLGFVAKVSQIELAVDFPYTRKLERFFNRYSYLKYNRGNPCLVGKGTELSYYSGHKAHCVKTSIVYPKDIDMTENLRVEIILNRRVVKNLGFDLTMQGINNIDFSKLVCFKKWNYERFFKYLKWRNRYKLSGMKPQFIPMYLRLVEDVELNYKWIKYTMHAIAHLKKRGHQRPQRFFDNMSKANREFYKLVQGKQFLR